jgi:hypothetical protein
MENKGACRGHIYERTELIAFYLKRRRKVKCYKTIIYHVRPPHKNINKKV